MKVALDSSVLFDVWLPGQIHAESSASAIQSAFEEAQLCIAEPVYAELAACFPDRKRLDHFLDETGVEVEPVTRDGAWGAGKAYKAYRKSGGSRSRILADFLIAGHAISVGAQLLTRDRGFFRLYFKELELYHPSRA